MERKEGRGWHASPSLLYCTLLKKGFIALLEQKKEKGGGGFDGQGLKENGLYFIRSPFPFQLEGGTLLRKVTPSAALFRFTVPPALLKASFAAFYMRQGTSYRRKQHCPHIKGPFI